MRHQRRAAVLSAAFLLALPVAAQAASPSAPGPASLASTAQDPRLQPWLDGHLATLTDAARVRVMVRATSAAAAADAVEAVGMGVQQRWPMVGIAVGVGPASAVRGLLAQPGVLYVEGDTPLAYTLQTAHQATRSDQALVSYPTADGTGVTVAVIDSGIDGTHPAFRQGAASKVVQNRKNVCGIDLGIDPGLSETCFAQAPTNDTDTISGGGHGTHVAGIAAGVPVTTTSPAGTNLRGSAPGAKLVGLSVGAAIGLLDAAAAQNWVLEHQQNPCRSAAEQTADVVDADCPPIRVTNHSYGPIATEGEDQAFSEDSASVQLQRALVGKGVVAVWAAGNDGGDGSFAATNPDAMDPTPGIVMVASYDDAQRGDPDNQLSTFSSRGKRGSAGTYPDLAAPGDRITSACRATLVVCQGAPSFDGGNYQTISGTSMASPYVAGVVAALLAADPTLTPARVEAVLEDTAHRFVAGGAYESDPTNPSSPTSFDKGHGLVDVLAAVTAVAGSAGPVPGGGTGQPPVACVPAGKQGTCKGRGGKP